MSGAVPLALSAPLLKVKSLSDNFSNKFNNAR